MTTDAYLDGNVAAGALGELFALDLTVAVGGCVSCGRVSTLADTRVYVDAPGVVVRCVGCDHVLLRLVRSPDRSWLDATGLAFLEVAMLADTDAPVDTRGHPHSHGQGETRDDELGLDVACAIAHGEVAPPVEDRRLVAVFASPVARELAHTAAHVGFEVVVLEPDDDADWGPLTRVADVSGAQLDARTDVVVTDHDRPELGDLLADVLREPSRWVGVMGSPRHTAPHVELLRARGFDEADIGRVHRPIGLDIGSHAPAEIALATVAGLIADRNGRPGSPYRA